MLNENKKHGSDGPISEHPSVFLEHQNHSVSIFDSDLMFLRFCHDYTFEVCCTCA